MKIYPPGASVNIGTIEAIVTSVCINNEWRVTYQCAWWDGTTRKSEWLESFEVNGDLDRCKEIGFHEMTRR